MRLAVALALVGCASCASPDTGRGAASLSATTQTEIVLDRRPDGARLLGRVEPVPPNADPDRVLVLRTERGGGGVLEPSLDGARVLDARFVGGGAIAVIGADHVLRIVADGRTQELDHAAEPPISVAGAAIAYVRGEMPFFELARADVRTGEVRQLTQGMAPAWSPALSPDGREVIFVSSASGRPRLVRLHADGTISMLPAVERVPSSPFAPRWEGTRLRFVDEHGEAVLDLERGRLLEEAP